ncbi:oligosaccharide flippase family protein [Patescibacteria group bacterium]|nr:oligosaccharide flippase family protein [Patescibacteria group bacterium]MBU1256080.1 oligosaccharide flippase family protein [Patescibacteria group bacterium]MBU1457618.1 oligosaccharide flippase family protein [Patescibacteria group bacterium]
MDKIKSLLTSQTSKDTAISLAGSGVVAVAGVVFTILLARALEPESFGIYSSLAAIVGIVSVLGDLGIGSALVNFLPKLPNKRQVLVATSFWFQIIIATIFSILISVLAFINHTIVPGSIPVHLILAGVLTGIYIINQYAVGLLKAEKRFLEASIVQAVDSLGKLGLIFVFLTNNQLTIGAALLFNSISVVISTIYALRLELNNLPLILPKLYLKKIFKFAKWIGLSRAFGVAVSRVDIILLNLMHSSFSAGIFAAASRVGLVFALVVSALGSVVAPRFSGFTKRTQTIGYLKKLFLLTSLISLAMLVMVALAKPIVLLVFGVKYLEAIPVFQVLTIALIPFLFSIITSNPIIYTYNQPDYFAKITIIQVVILVALDIILIPSLGAMAPAISIGVSNLVVLALGGIRLKKLLA